jgi:hypothetical protein
MITPQRSVAMGLLLALPLGALAHGSKHEHGVARLDIAVEARQIVVQFDSPLDNLVGFERAPRTDAERKRADEAVARLKDGDKMFQFDAGAGCKMVRFSLDSPALGYGSASPGEKDSADHADLLATWEFQCADASKAAQVDVGLFAFNPLKIVQVQLALPKAQAKRELKRPKNRILLSP